MKHFFSFIQLLIMFLLYSTNVMAQQTTGQVIDSKSGEPVPFASIYVSENNGTLTNEEGRFTIDLKAGETVQVSFLGYKKRLFNAGSVPKTIKMEPIDTQMRELTVLAPNSILKKIIKRLDTEYKTKESKTACFFLRQTFQQTNGRNEMVEAFMTSASAINLRKTAFISARHYRIGDHSEVANVFVASNLQHLFDFAPRVYETAFWNDVAVPLGLCRTLSSSSALIGSGGIFSSIDSKSYDNYEKVAKYYDTRIEEYAENGEDYFKIHFTRNEGQYNKGLLVGTLYVQVKGYKILRFEGHMSSVSLDTEKDFWTQENLTEPVVRIGYTHRHGFTEVEYVACNMEAAGMKCRSMAYNLGVKKIKAAKANKVKLENNMLDAVDRAGYDSTLWQQTSIIRTAEEERIATECLSPDNTAGVLIAKEDEARRYNPDSLSYASRNFRPLVERLRAFGRTIPQEKIYIHMDNTSYQLGDTIWFSAYTRRTDTGRPSDVSGVLYVELYGQEGYLVERKLIRMQDGQGDGFFALNKLIQYAGLYELRAYTRWQLNWGVYERKHSPWAFKWFDSRELEHAYFTDYEKLYSRVFPVYDKPKQPGDFSRNTTLKGNRRSFRRDRDKRKLTLALYPEGGSLVQGKPCRMAFEAAWDDGEWVDGWLYCGTDSAKVANRGRGAITITSTGKKKQKAIFIANDGTKASTTLPEADTMGVALRMEQVEDRWAAHITPTGNLPAQALALTLMHEGRTIAFRRLEALEERKDSRLFAVDDSLLASSGVYQLTIFDIHGRVYADRLFFVKKPEEMKPTLSVSGLKSEYAPYEPVELHVKAAQNTGSVSLTVRDDNTRDFLHDNGTILTEMLLASEIRGFVPDPRWYFESDDSTHRQALELLLMTQGWRRFRWRDMAVRGAWELTQPAEQAPVIKGGVYKYNWNRNKDFGIRKDDVLRPSLSMMFRRDSEDSKPAMASIGKEAEARAQDPAAIHKEGETQEDYERQQRMALRNDHDYVTTRYYQKADKDVKMHSELVSTDGRQIFVNERATNNGRFQIQLPPFYGEAQLFISAADTTKWNRRKRRRYAWIQGSEYHEDFDPRAPYNRFKKAGLDVKHADYISRVQWPYPRFVEPYDHYQTALSDRPQTDTVDTDSMHALRQVTVNATRSMLRRFDDSQPCLIMDGEDAANLVFDAGMHSLARYMVADYGMYYPFVSNPNWTARDPGDPDDHMERRVGITESRRNLPPYRDIFEHVPQDSIYARKYLISIPAVQSREEATEYRNGIDKMLIYTDYNRRMPGNWRYVGADLPYTTQVSYPWIGPEPKMEYRDRHYTIYGFSYPAEFYSPDYSHAVMPDTATDYRRTLYWNPRLKLDSQGQAIVRFYNCARQTEPSADAQGQAHDGTLLWGGER